MKPEIEAKFLDVNHEELRQKLQLLGATCEKPLRLMKRKNYDFPDKRLEKIGGWVRVRDEGDKITLSYKQLDDRSLHGTQEVCLVVDNFAEAASFLQAIGLVPHADEESKRESWELDGVEIDLDEWPWIKPFVEIEGPSEESVWTVAKKLGLDPNMAKHGSVEIAYQAEYDVTEEEARPSQTLFGPVPAWLEARRKKVL